MEHEVENNVGHVNFDKLPQYKINDLEDTSTKGISLFSSIKLMI